MLRFAVECRSSAQDNIYDINVSALCNEYKTTYNSDQVTLQSDLNWFDEICDAEMFLVRFESEMTFWRNDSFTEQLGDGDQYQLGDMAYVQVVVGDPELITVVGLALDNVWICTTSPDNEPLNVTQPNLGSGGCLSAGLDPGFPKHIVLNGADLDNSVKGDVTVFGPFANNTVQFAFPIEFSVERTNLYVHAQITLDITPDTRRRRSLLQSEDGATASQNVHFSDSVSITSAPLEAEEDAEGDDVVQDLGVVETLEKDAEELPTYAVVLISVIATALVCLCTFTVLGVCYREHTVKKAQRRQMQGV